MSDLTVAVREYLKAGLHLLALHGKRPNSRYHEAWDWDNSIHGIPETAEDEVALEAVFTHHTTTGVAILIPQNVLVADVDTEEAATLYMDLAGGLSDTAVTKTTKGLHIWFLAPGAEQSVWLGGRTLLFKGFGGYVAAPPSRHFTDDTVTEQDGVYAWINEYGEGIGWLPEAFAARLKVQEELVRPPRAPGDGAYIEVEFTTDTSGVPDGKWRLWRRWHMDGLCKAIIEAPDGNQNNLIHWAACSARDEGVSYETAMSKLLDAAIKGGHPIERARATIRGAYKRGSRG